MVALSCPLQQPAAPVGFGESQGAGWAPAQRQSRDSILTRWLLRAAACRDFPQGLQRSPAAHPAALAPPAPR